VLAGWKTSDTQNNSLTIDLEGEDLDDKETSTQKHL